MAHVPRILEPQCEWTSDQLADESRWTEVFTPAELAELHAALRHALARSEDVLEIGRDDFPLPKLHERLLSIERELIDGRGFVRLRGIERERYSQAEMEMLYWGIGMHLGSPWAQNHKGHVLGDVTDQGKALDDPTARGNELGGTALPFHCDGSDLVGLLCLCNGLRGGYSQVANSVRIHSELLAALAATAAVGPLAGCATSGSGKSIGKVVVVGAGYGGATAAKYLRLWSEGTIEVTLVDPNEAFVSCPISNLVLAGSRTMTDITVSYAGLEQHGVKRLRDTVTAIDADKKQVRLASGGTLPYDRLVVSPGIEFMYDRLQGWSSRRGHRAACVEGRPADGRAAKATRRPARSASRREQRGDGVHALPPIVGRRLLMRWARGQTPKEPGLAASNDSASLPDWTNDGRDPERMTPDFWIERLPDADRVLANSAAIAAQNERLRALGPAVRSLDALPDRLDGAWVRERIESVSRRPTRTLYDGHGVELTRDEIDALVDKLALDSIPASQPARFGLVIHRALLRTFPTVRQAFDRAGDTAAAWSRNP